MDITPIEATSDSPRFFFFLNRGEASPKKSPLPGGPFATTILVTIPQGTPAPFAPLEMMVSKGSYAEIAMILGW